MNISEAQAAVSKEIREAIKAATPKPVYPKDEFGEPTDCGDGRQQATIRVAGWDPDEKQSNEALLRRSSACLVSRGWSVVPEWTDSDDQSARVAKAGIVVDGRLLASNQGLTFTATTQA